ncbi:hypothetical protein BIV25_13615 [Streptomyces sp. MUSC 14]|uniref:hypothetical protein n=1 Tax=Streptomyces sp. MUSC 14 TaxID=1354889 RepID=UPI0008F56ED6|nr:hypothetical protein [Streptomyces sp. MUSC 14]OIJ97833.1 hypothetical protein BIV25_13615 [Streptomyces sp. MUSC 14]
MANPGYGKRSVPGQRPRTNHDFAHLPAREAAIAAYLDRLPDGADISVKTLAKVMPYGQCALGTALNRLQKAGHLRRGRERLAGADGVRWITRSWWSRTARDDDWWATFARGDVPQPEPPPEDQARPAPTRSRAHILLAALGRTAPVMSLSAADCAELAPLVAEWFVRGADDSAVLHALTAGLPSPVHHPAALVRSRLTSKLPPEPVRQPPRPPRRILECAECGVPGRPEALADGLCRACRGAPPRDRAHPNGPLAAPAIRSYAAEMRAAILQKRQERTLA